MLELLYRWTQPCYHCVDVNTGKLEVIHVCQIHDYDIS